MNRIAVACLAIAASSVGARKSSLIADSLLERGQAGARGIAVLCGGARQTARSGRARSARTILGRAWRPARGGHACSRKRCSSAADAATLSAESGSAVSRPWRLSRAGELAGVAAQQRREGARGVARDASDTRHRARFRAHRQLPRFDGGPIVGRLPIRINSHIVDALVDVVEPRHNRVRFGGGLGESADVRREAAAAYTRSHGRRRRLDRHWSADDHECADDRRADQGAGDHRARRARAVRAHVRRSGSSE